MTQKNWMLLAAAGSFALMVGALLFQYVGGLPPCKLCYWQRYPHVIAILLGAAAVFAPNRSIALAGAAAAATTAGIGIYHTGVERGWWEGPTSCASGRVGGLSTDDLMNQIMSAPLVRCDEVPWELFTLSMASWNAVISLFLMAMWVMALKPRT